MEALFHEILAPPPDADAFAAAAQVMDLDGAACMPDDERKESGQGAEEKEEEETKKTLEGQRQHQQQQQAQQDDEMKKILDEMIGMTSDEAAAVTTMPLEYYGSAFGLGLGLDLGLGMSADFDIGGWDVADVYSPAPAAAHSVSGVVF